MDDLGLDGPTEATGSEDLGTEEANQEGNTMEKNDNSELAEDQGEQEGPNIQNAAIKALMVLNYLDILHRTKSFTALRTAMPYKEFLVDCLKCLSQKQREKLVVGAVPAFRGVDVFFTHAQHEALLHAVVQEVAFSTSNLSLLAFISSAQQQAALKAKQEEEAARIAAEEASAAAATEEDDHKSLSSSTLTKTSAQLRREKKAKYAEQRAKDNQLRIQVSRQRALLYEYIRTDKISEVFAAQASTTMTAHSAFGVDVDEAKKLEEERNAFAEVATAMAEQTMERTKTREDAMAKTPKGPSSPSQF